MIEFLIYGITAEIYALVIVSYLRWAK